MQSSDHLSGSTTISKIMMKAWRLLLLTLLISHYSCAQVSQMPASDSVGIPPGTIVVIGNIASASKDNATLNVQEIVGSGQGIINMLSAGQKTTVHIAGGIRLQPGERIRAHLKEKLEADASRSSYELVRMEKLKP
jgi:hypothetical protein